MPNKVKSNFLIRAITAFFFVILIIASITINKYLFGILFLIVNALVLTEFYTLVEKGGFTPQKRYGVLIGSIVFGLSFLAANNIVSQSILILIIPLIIISFIIEIYSKSEHPFTSLSFTFFGIVYITMPFSVLNYISAPDVTNNVFSYKILLPFFAILWASDTGAYIVGSLIGKHKLIERISPKKTWEGVFGGIAFSMLTAFIISFFITELSPFSWVLLAIIIAVFGTYGDLSESLLKRRAKVKDSGNLLPGHGGVFDRFDSVTFAAPAAFIFLKIISLL